VASRYLLLEFDDAAQAEKLMQQINARTREGKAYRVIGLFAKPQAPYCGCGREVTTRSNESTLKRGMKFGWWVCTVCKRPAASISGLRNLINPDDIIEPSTFMYGVQRLMFYFISISAPSKGI
jgi:hypothetical protein